MVSSKSYDEPKTTQESESTWFVRGKTDMKGEETEGGEELHRNSNDSTCSNQGRGGGLFFSSVGNENGSLKGAGRWGPFLGRTTAVKFAPRRIRERR